MSYTLLKGSFVIRYPDLSRQGPEPDGDTVKFLPDTPALVEAPPRPSGRPADLNARGISDRLEAIDALETHFGETHRELLGANAARDELLRQLGFSNVVFFPDLPNKVQSADQDSVPVTSCPTVSTPMAASSTGSTRATIPALTGQRSSSTTPWSTPR